MGKILGIAIKNYGSLKDVKMGQLYSDQAGVPLGNMVAIIGPSGNGKSTLADAFGFIADALTTDVESACDASNRGGYDKLVSQGSDGPIHFEIYYKENSNSRPITYELTVGKDKNDRPYVRTGDKVDVELNDIRKLGIVTLGAMKQYSRIEKFLAFLKSWYLCYFTPDTARQVQIAAPAPYLNRTGSNLNNVAQFMYRENPSDFRKILANIQTKIPNINRIEPVRMQNGQMVLEFWQNGFSEPFFSQRMSDGTLKLFAYYMLLHEKNPRQLVFIEEPENGLYHQYLADLAIEMSKNVGTGYSKQLFVTTHSPFFVNALSPEQVWVLDKGPDGFSTIKRSSEYDFVSDLVQEGAYIGDLWNSKYFG